MFASLLIALILDEPVKLSDGTLGANPPEGAIVLFDGKSLDGWVKSDGKTPAAWPVENGAMKVGKGQGSIMTAKPIEGSYKLHIEFNVPLMPNAKGQARGNSGVYLSGAYELQVLDSYGLKPQTNDCGAIYQQVAPKVNACKPRSSGRPTTSPSTAPRRSTAWSRKKPGSRSSRTASRSSTTPRSAPLPAAPAPKKPRQDRSCSRTTGMMCSFGIFGSRRFDLCRMIACPSVSSRFYKGAYGHFRFNQDRIE